MTIQDFDTIDMIVGLKDGGVRLIIVDPGSLPPEERLDALMSKLEAYGAYIHSHEYRDKYEGWRNTVIDVKSPVEPTDAMREIQGIQVADGPEKRADIMVTYTLIEPSL